MGDSVYVWAQTISKSCYDVFDQMIRQFRSDGGAYTPAPSSVGSNISGGGVWLLPCECGFRKRYCNGGKMMRSFFESIRRVKLNVNDVADLFLYFVFELSGSGCSKGRCTRMCDGCQNG